LGKEKGVVFFASFPSEREGKKEGEGGVLAPLSGEGKGNQRKKKGEGRVPLLLRKKKGEKGERGLLQKTSFIRKRRGK